MADEYNMKKKRKRGPYRRKEIIKKDGLPIPVLTLNGSVPTLDLTSNESTEQLHENYIFESEVNQSFVFEDEIQNNLLSKESPAPEASMVGYTSHVIYYSVGIFFYPEHISAFRNISVIVLKIFNFRK